MIDRITWTPADWLCQLVREELFFLSDDDRIGWVIELSRRNVLERTGGPFAAAVFDRSSGRLVAAGTNRVVPLGSSLVHAEIMALASAHAALGHFDLGAPGLGSHELVASAQPCLMCTGAVLWSGVSRLVYAAGKAEVESLLGFDEGPLAPGWAEALAERGIEVSVAPQSWQEAACAVLELYRETGGPVYNPGRASQRESQSAQGIHAAELAAEATAPSPFKMRR